MTQRIEQETLTEKFLDCRNLTFFYPEDTSPVLEEITFSLDRGEIMVVCGESGCGKTTLLRHMKKNQNPFGEKTGTVFLEGHRLEEISARQSVEMIGFVGQHPEEQLVTDTVWHELSFAMENLGYPSEVIRKKTGEIAQYFGIASWFRQKVSALSGGQKQILNLAAVMVLKPELLILDEPTAQLDPISGEHFLKTLLQLNQDFGTTILLSEQRLESVLPMADKVMILHQGKNAAWGNTEKLPQLLQAARSKMSCRLPVEDALPVALRVFLEVEKENINPPLSVGQGRQWLQKKGISLLKKKEYDEFCPKKADSKKKSYVLEAKDISFSYQSGGISQRVLEHFCLGISRGEIYGIVGGNGSGKTTALKILAGVVSPQSGRVKSKGRVLYLAQNPKSIFTEITVWEELGEAFETWGSKTKKPLLSTEEMKEKIEKMLHWLELTKQRHQNPMDLSGGQQQRLALGKILLMEPDIVLLDEPTKGMDSAFKKKFSSYLRELSQNGMAVVVVTHDLEFCARNTSHCGFLFDGALLSSGETRSFFEDSTFYTTQGRRMTEGLLPHCILWEDIVEQLQGGKQSCGK